MFNIDYYVLINRGNCCYKSIKTLSSELSNTASNDLFICHVKIFSLSKNIEKLEEFLDKFTKKLTLFASAKLSWLTQN